MQPLEALACPPGTPPGAESRSTTWCSEDADSGPRLESQVVLRVWQVVPQMQKSRH